jgi:antibiotic biosynthesis monooxygenase (ABM) superfamily enzyme
MQALFNTSIELNIILREAIDSIELLIATLLISMCNIIIVTINKVIK